MMFEAAVTEFPFVEEMPKREKSKLVKVWDRLVAFKEIQEREGTLLSSRFVASLLDVSQQRVSELMKLGKLVRIDFEGHPFITEASVVAYAKSERKAGRPVKFPTNLPEAFDRARRAVKNEAEKS